METKNNLAPNKVISVFASIADNSQELWKKGGFKYNVYHVIYRDTIAYNLLTNEATKARFKQACAEAKVNHDVVDVRGLNRYDFLDFLDKLDRKKFGLTSLYNLAFNCRPHQGLWGGENIWSALRYSLTKDKGWLHRDMRYDLFTETAVREANV